VWNRSYSHDIEILDGVRQGAVLSPDLFCIYFDELIHALESVKDYYISSQRRENDCNANYYLL